MEIRGLPKVSTGRWRFGYGYHQVETSTWARSDVQVSDRL